MRGSSTASLQLKRDKSRAAARCRRNGPQGK